MGLYITNTMQSQIKQLRWYWYSFRHTSRIHVLFVFQHFIFDKIIYLSKTHNWDKFSKLRHKSLVTFLFSIIRFVAQEYKIIRQKGTSLKTPVVFNIKVVVKVGTENLCTNLQVRQKTNTLKNELLVKTITCNSMPHGTWTDKLRNGVMAASCAI